MTAESTGAEVAKKVDDVDLQNISDKKSSATGSKPVEDQNPKLTSYYAQKMAEQVPQNLRSDWMKEVESWTCNTKDLIKVKSKKWFENNELQFPYAKEFSAFHWSTEQVRQHINDSLVNIQSKPGIATGNSEPPELHKQSYEQVVEHDEAVKGAAEEPDCASERCVTPIEVLPPEVTARTTEQKQDRFLVLDARVRKGAQTMVDAAMALDEIKKDELYKPKFKTFAMYLKSVEGISRQYAHMLMKAGETAQEMSTIVDNHNDVQLRRDQIPQTESHLRVLSRLCDAKQRCEILAEVIKDKGPKYTAADLAKKIDPLVPLAQKKKLTSKRVPIENGTIPQAKVESALDELESLLSSLHNLDPQISELLRQIRDWMNPKSEGLQ